MHPLEVGEGSREASSAGIENRNGHFVDCLGLPDSEPDKLLWNWSYEEALRLFGGH